MQRLSKFGVLIHDWLLETMRNIQTVADKAAIGLSMACAIHCLAVPLLVVLLPALASLHLLDEAFHLWMLMAVVPTSAVALTLGCRKHGRYTVLIPGVLGIVTMCAAVLIGHDLLGEQGEKWLTLLGAAMVAAGHLWNHRLCSRSSCECPSQ